MSYSKPVVFSVTGTYGCMPKGEDDVYTIEEFKKFCDMGSFIDSDGHGYPVKDRLTDTSVIIVPSLLNHIPADATHIVWYNK